MRSAAIWYALGGGAILAVAGGVVIARNPDYGPSKIESLFSPPPKIAAAAPVSAPEPVVAPTPVATPYAVKPSVAPALGPAFDVVRVETSGDTVVAGHAAPGAKVELRDGERVLSSVVADEAGQFVILPEPLKAGSHQLRLAARVGDGEALVSEPSLVDLAPLKTAPTAVAIVPAPLASPTPKPPAPTPSPTASVVVASAPVPKNAPTAVAIVPAPLASPAPAPKPAPPLPSPTAAVVASAPAPKPAPPPPVVAPTPTPFAVAALAPMGKPNPTLATAPSSAGASRLAVRRVKATEPGRLEAEGEADPGSRLRLTLNGAFLADVAAGADGLWSLTIEHGMTAGLYALEAEELGTAGDPRARTSFAYPQNPGPSGAPLASVARAESAPVEAPKPTPEPHTAPDVVATAAPVAAEAKPSPPHEPAPAPKVASAQIDTTPTPTPTPIFANPSHAVVAEVRTTTVAPGDNLWDIALKYYNDGTRYSEIYAANAARIRNPSLIYIGQVFVLPQDKPRR